MFFILNFRYKKENTIKSCDPDESCVTAGSISQMLEFGIVKLESL